MATITVNLTTEQMRQVTATFADAATRDAWITELLRGRVVEAESAKALTDAQAAARAKLTAAGF